MRAVHLAVVSVTLTLGAAGDVRAAGSVTLLDAIRSGDAVAIRRLVEDWAVLRDARLWDRFREVWHDDGRMMATWFQGSRDEFIKVSEEGYQKGAEGDG